MSADLLVDPKKPFHFNALSESRYYFLIFCAMVAGKSAFPTARKLTELMDQSPELTLDGMYSIGPSEEEIKNCLIRARTGKYTLLTKFFIALRSDVLTSDNLCYLPMALYRDELVRKLPGIGMKSASFYKMYTDPRANVAVLDTHILKYLDSEGIANVPRSTPQSRRRYLELEHHFLVAAKDWGVNPWVLDIFLWNMYNQKRTWDTAQFGSFVNDCLTNPEYAAYVAHSET